MWLATLAANGKRRPHVLAKNATHLQFNSHPDCKAAGREPLKHELNSGMLAKCGMILYELWLCECTGNRKMPQQRRPGSTHLRGTLCGQHVLAEAFPLRSLLGATRLRGQHGQCRGPGLHRAHTCSALRAMSPGQEASRLGCDGSRRRRVPYSGKMKKRSRSFTCCWIYNWR